MLSLVVEESKIQSLTSRETLELQALQRTMTMFTIDGEGQEYSDFWIAMIAARKQCLDLKRSVRIVRNGKVIKFLRY
jgi:hypothetical protein